jgi:cytochrome c peroxidase
VAKANLGKALFWDEQLSSTGTVSCGTCHMPETGGADPRSLSSPFSIHPGPDKIFGTADDVRGSEGVPLHVDDGHYVKDPTFGFHAQVTGRKAQSAIGTGYSSQLFWDGRAGEVLVDPVSGQVILKSGAALESQVLAPPVSDVEMGHLGRTWTDVIARISNAEVLALSDVIPTELENWIANRTYPDLFLEAFGTGEIDAGRIAMAIASYERTLVPNQTPWDLVLAGAPVDLILTGQEQQGLLAFLDPDTGGCGNCHNSGIGPERFTDERFHYIGVRPHVDDMGRFDVTGNPADAGKFRTPSMRNVELRAPYMHNGGLDSLEDVIEFYNRGGDFDAPNKHFAITDLNLSVDLRRSLVAFLGRPMTDPRVAKALPPFDRPSQFADSLHVPEVFGEGTPGSAGVEPQIIAIEALKVGGGTMTVAIDRGLGGAAAILLINSSAVPGGVLQQGALLYPSTLGRRMRVVPALHGVGPGEGWGSLVLPMPENVGLLGTEFFAQWIVIDGGVSGRLAASPAIRMEWF